MPTTADCYLFSTFVDLSIQISKRSILCTESLVYTKLKYASSVIHCEYIAQCTKLSCEKFFSSCNLGLVGANQSDSTMHNCNKFRTQTWLSIRSLNLSPTEAPISCNLTWSNRHIVLTFISKLPNLQKTHNSCQCPK